MSRERARRSTLPPAQENIGKLEKVVSEGNFYGAQQMYKSVSARYIAAERYAEALDILESGACLQLQNGQITCGAELAALFVEALVKGKYACDDETLDRVRKIYKKFPQMSIPERLGDDDDMQQLSEALAAAKTRVECCSSFLKAALKWSSQFGPHRAGSPELHSMLAEYIYSESPEVDMAKVSFHFVRGNNPKKFASTLVNFMGKCYPGEDDLAIARGILMYLSSGNLRDANNLLDGIKQQLESKQQDFPKSDLMQFIDYLLQVLQRDALPLFNMLKGSYKPSIDRDPAFHEVCSLNFHLDISLVINGSKLQFSNFICVLDRLSTFINSCLLWLHTLYSVDLLTLKIAVQFLDLIAERFYGVQRRNPLQGMFGDIFKMMGGE